MPPYCSESETDIGLRVYGHFDDKEKHQFVVELTERELARLEDWKGRQLAGLIAPQPDCQILASLVNQLCVQKLD